MGARVQLVDDRLGECHLAAVGWECVAKTGTAMVRTLAGMCVAEPASGSRSR